VSAPSPYYDEDGITLYCGDCREVMPLLDHAEMGLLTDPSYGLVGKWSGGTWFTRGVYQGAVPWDMEAPHEIVADLVKRGAPSIIWGGNYFAVPPSRCWLAWMKTNAVPTMADFEIAWTNLDRPSAAFSRPCNGWRRDHPTEKPVDLIQWAAGFLPDAIALVDPFAGSGTTLVAAKNLARRAIGIEIEERYCEIAVKRLRQGVLPL
jgi:DNA modification methylase